MIYITNASKVDSDGSKLYTKVKVNSVQNSLVSGDFLENVEMRDSTVRRLSVYMCYDSYLMNWIVFKLRNSVDKHNIFA